MKVIAYAHRKQAKVSCDGLAQLRQLIKGHGPDET